jgi:anti-sigma B factor antagonist
VARIWPGSRLPDPGGQQDHRSVAELSGGLDIACAPALREQRLGLVRPGSSRGVIDLSKVSHCDAPGLAVLIGTGRRARLLGGFLRLAAVSPQVDQGLHITGLRPPSRRLPHRPGRDSQPAQSPRHEGLSDGGVPDPLTGGGLTMGRVTVSGGRSRTPS